ncbi:hypothetical protein HMPREF1985_01067 [Mitsuokella sp. oral taxon 131 str. W9106]|nr:hypothetical protein HMPREF1985_01067 [Mitsuokella sp. oral taxon 131 str. W9106]
MAVRRRGFHRSAGKKLPQDGGAECIHAPISIRCSDKAYIHFYSITFLSCILYDFNHKCKPYLFKKSFCIDFTDIIYELLPFLLQK